MMKLSSLLQERNQIFRVYIQIALGININTKMKWPSREFHGRNEILGIYIQAIESNL